MFRRCVISGFLLQTEKSVIPHRVRRAGRGGFFYPRLLLATVLGFAGVLLAVSAFNARATQSRGNYHPDLTSKLQRWVVDHTANGKQAEFLVVLSDQADLAE